MSNKLFELCPKCKTDLSNALSRYFFENHPGLEFDYTCGGCGLLLNIEVELNPQFYCDLAFVGETNVNDEGDHEAHD